jgi:hypothetical protein
MGGLLPGDELLKIRPLKTTRVTIEDTEAENCLGKAKFTSEGCAGTRAQHAQGADHRSAFLSLMWWGPAPFTRIGPVQVHNLLMTG